MMLSHHPLLCDAFTPPPAAVRKSTAIGPPILTAATPQQRPARDAAAAAKSISRVGSLLLWLPASRILTDQIMAARAAS